jgi:hypothetical protein
MGERFYLAQKAATGSCPGSLTKRRRNMAWTDEKRQQVIERYLELEPTPENSIELVQQIADEVEETPNGVRLILSKADVYVKKSTPASGSSKATGEAKPRVSKADAIEKLIAVITETGVAVDEEITGKLTGKAAIYLTKVITAAMDK